MSQANPGLFTEKMLSYIKEDGRSQATIARQLGEKPATFNKWVHCENRMPDGAIHAFCKLLGLDKSQLAELLQLAGYTIVIDLEEDLALTNEEHQIMQLLSVGYVFPAIAGLMGCSVSYIDSKLIYSESASSILFKLKVRELPDAVVRYREKYKDALDYLREGLLSTDNYPFPRNLIHKFASNSLTGLTILYLTLILSFFIPIWYASYRTTPWNDYSNIYLVLALYAGMAGLSRCCHVTGRLNTFPFHWLSLILPCLYGRLAILIGCGSTSSTRKIYLILRLVIGPISPIMYCG